MLNWDDVRLFLAVRRSGRLVAAARILGIDNTTIARRLTALETALGTRLFERSPRGVELTETGALLVPYAERIEAQIEDMCAALGTHDGRLAGIVRLTTPEAFGTSIVAPHLAAFHARFPDLRLELRPEPVVANLANNEADIAIVLNRPLKGRIFTRRLADFRLCVYAGRDYLDRHGPITSVADHPFAGYLHDQAGDAGLFMSHEVVVEAQTVFRSTSIHAQHAAVADGLGLGLLHAFLADADPRLVRVLPQIELQRSYWLALHADRQHLPRVRAVVEFLDELVEARRGQF